MSHTNVVPDKRHDMSEALRRFFDSHLEKVLRELPREARVLLEDVSLIVADHPSREIMREMGIRYRDELCGLYSGTPLPERSVELSGVPSDVIYLYREGILALSRDAGGEVREVELREQMRITILHELGHYHGFDEERLERLGY